MLNLWKESLKDSAETFSLSSIKHSKQKTACSMT